MILFTVLSFRLFHLKMKRNQNSGHLLYFSCHCLKKALSRRCCSVDWTPRKPSFSIQTECTKMVKSDQTFIKFHFVMKKPKKHCSMFRRIRSFHRGIESHCRSMDCKVTVCQTLKMITSFRTLAQADWFI